VTHHYPCSHRLGRVGLLLLLALPLSACTTFFYGDEQEEENQGGDVVLGDATPEERLTATAESIERSLSVLASAQTAKSPPVLRTAPLITPRGGMGGRADIDWVGPIAPLLDRIATMTNYRVKILGPAPSIPIVVSIYAKDTVIAEILQNASLQAGTRAQILVFPETHVIEIRYLSSS